ncbi:MAG: hypothetical protein ABI670_01190 [Chloroflexota bacterium]
MPSSWSEDQEMRERIGAVWYDSMDYRTHIILEPSGEHYLLPPRYTPTRKGDDMLDWLHWRVTWGGGAIEWPLLGERVTAAQIRKHCTRLPPPVM